MASLSRHVRRLGGAATTHELVELGFSGRRLAAALRSGELVRVRCGWYTVPDLDLALRTAVRVGGRLACVSAAAHYGWATPEEHGVHLCVAENAGRLRRPKQAAAAASDGTRPTSAGTRPESAGTQPADTGTESADTGTEITDTESVVVHWGSARQRDDRSRLVTDRFETVMHLVECLDSEVAVAILDSFLHREPHRSRQLEAWLGELPPHALARLPSRNALCHSYLESIGRIRLERAGLTGEHQVEIPGVGRVDMVIDGRLVIEWDGGTHRTAEQQHEDCRRDALLATLGYRTLRFSYGLVMHEWYIVIAAIHAALDEVGCVH